MQIKFIIYTMLMSSIFLISFEYIGKIEPFEKYEAVSEAKGRIVLINEKQEYSNISGKTLIIKIDTELDKIDLQNFKDNLIIQKQIFKIRTQNYNNKLKIPQLSYYTKNQEKLLLLESKQRISDLKKAIKKVEKNIKDKKFFIKNKYLNEIYIQDKDYIGIGTKLFDYYDFSKIKIVLYIRPQDLNKIEKSKYIYLDGKKTDFYIYKLSVERDKFRISTYKIILYKNNLTLDSSQFGKIVKVEFK